MKRTIVIFDTETTGLPKATAAPLSTQPAIIELGAIKVDWETLEEIERLDILINPGKSKLPLEDVIVKITGITTKDLQAEGVEEFGHHFHAIAEFFTGVNMFAAHNLAFDKKMLLFDLKRIGKASFFPWPTAQVCTVDSSYKIEGRRMKQDELFELAKVKGEIGSREATGSHRAINDAEDLLVCFRYLVANGHISLDTL